MAALIQGNPSISTEYSARNTLHVFFVAVVFAVVTHSVIYSHVSTLRVELYNHVYILDKLLLKI